MSLDIVLSRLEAVRRAGDGFLARCPAHEDRGPSLSLKDAGSGRVLWHCLAGCPPSDVERALLARGLSPEELHGRNGHGSPVTTEWPIKDASGRAIAVHVRTDEPGRPKRLWWRRPNGDRGLGGLRSADLPLYRTPEILASPATEPVFIVEGEKAADALVRLGLAAAATVTGAAGCPSRAVLEVLRGRDVVAWPDADPEGRLHMQKVAGALTGVARRVRIFGWKLAPRKGDAADFVAAGRTRDDLMMIVAEEAEDPGRVDAGNVHDAPNDDASAVDRLKAAAAPALEHPRPLDMFEESLRAMGLGGNLALARTVFLAATTRVLSRRKKLHAHTFILGPASSGKSFELEAALQHLPADAVVSFDGCSPRALIYSDQEIQHRVLVYSELDSLPMGNGEEDAANAALTFLRTLVVNGVATYDVVQRGKEGFATRRITREGPAALLVTGTRRLSDDQLASRLHEVEVTVDRERLRSLVAAQGRMLLGTAAAGPEPSLVALQRYLQALAPVEVTIPFAGVLGPAILDKAKVTDPRLTREFSRVAGFAAAHALLSIERRVRTHDGAVIVELEDYEAAREVVRELSTVRAFSKFQIEVWGSADELHRETARPVTVAQVAKTLLKDHNNVRKAVNGLVLGGALRDVRDRPTRTSPILVVPTGENPHRIPLPTAAELLERGYTPPNYLPKQGQVEAGQEDSFGYRSENQGTEASPLSPQELTPLRCPSPGGKGEGPPDEDLIAPAPGVDR